MLTCEDDGLALAYDRIIRFFTPEPTLKPAQKGTPCPLCGSQLARLWRTSSGEVKCLAQLGISGKRAGRAETDAVIPRPDLSGKVCFGDGAMLIAGEHVARVVTRLYPVSPIPNDVVVLYPTKGTIRAELTALAQNPPEPPFVVIVFGQKAGFSTQITVDTSLLVINGPDPYVIDRAYLLELARLFEALSAKERSEILSLRARLALGTPLSTDRAAMARLKTNHPEVVRIFRRLPAPGSATSTFLNRILE